MAATVNATASAVLSAAAPATASSTTPSVLSEELRDFIVNILVDIDRIRTDVIDNAIYEMRDQVRSTRPSRTFLETMQTPRNVSNEDLKTVLNYLRNLLPPAKK